MNAVPDARPAIYFDADCALCTRAAWFVDRHDRRRTARMLSLRGAEARQFIAEHPRLAGVDSLVWVEPQPDGRVEVLTHSAAVVAVGRYLGGRWAAAAALLWCVPRPVRDWGYRLAARHRHRLRLPTA